MEGHFKLKKLRQNFGVVVRRRRHKLNVSQEELAHRADIHRTYMSSIELGKVDIGISVAYKVASALEIPLNKLIKEAEDS